MFTYFYDEIKLQKIERRELWGCDQWTIFRSQELSSSNNTDVNTSEEPQENVTVTSETDEQGARDNVTLTGYHEATTPAVQSVQPPVAAELRTDAAQDKQLLVPQGE